jgi:DNA invertase Pin-like site-specific DNA recombinase
VTNVVGYVRVSSDEQVRSGAGLEAQRSAIDAECLRRGWNLVEVHEDRAASGGSVRAREGLRRALGRLEDGSAEALVVAKLDRLSRSLLDFAQLMERSRREGWALVALDLGVDTTSPSGALMANVLASFAEFERRLIGQRTREALAVKRRQGVRLGRPAQMDPRLRARILLLGEQGASLAAISAELNASGASTAHGGRRWYPATVRRVLTPNKPSRTN